MPLCHDKGGGKDFGLREATPPSPEFLITKAFSLTEHHMSAPGFEIKCSDSTTNCKSLEVYLCIGPCLFTIEKMLHEEFGRIREISSIEQ
mmetsp:Transcript_4809/g.7142  ORF Transcript_4809/g.7142 Transcript_4809/m.7142 type:complete len:90 (-) Transcript_4809:168-437(-)